MNWRTVWFKLLRRKKKGEIYPDEIFLDSSNLPQFDSSQFEGRIEKSLPKKTIFYFGVAFIIVVFIFVGRVFFLQIVHGQAYTDRADDQYVTESSSIFSRGSIFFSDGHSAAIVESGYIVAIKPGKLDDKFEVFEKLSSIIELDEEEFLQKASKIGDPYEEIAHRITEDQRKEIEGLKLSGISTHKERWRYYPGNNTASHILGFVGWSGDVLTGIYGIERYYNDILSRKDDGVQVNFFAEIFSNITDSILEGGNSREGDVVLTIEPTTQVMLEETLASVKEKWSSNKVGGIIIDPKTGRIYAMSVLPDFNPNEFQDEKQEVFLNPIIESVYEMGSIVKPLTVAAAIDAGVIDSSTTYNDKGYIILDGARIENFDGKARGVVPIQEVLSQSLNTGAVFAMQKLGKEKFRDYMLAYGIEEETGIELPGEVHGITGNLYSTRDIEYATASFGQGIAMTPIATARAMSSIANGGLLITPHIVDNIDYRILGSKKTYPDEGIRVIKKSTSEEITRMLVKVVDEALLGGTVAMPHYSIAAKTGTAQIADNVNGGYYSDRYLHSFFGYFPAYDPKFLIFLYNLEPVGARYASRTLTEPFIDLVSFLINHYEVSPDR